MKATFLAVALLMSGAAIAQTTSDADTMTDSMADTSAQADTTVRTDTPDTDTDTSTHSSMDMGTHSSTTMDQQSSTTMSSNMTMASNMPGQVVQPGNQNPEEDARGISVISAPAVVPAGWNGVGSTAAMGGPLVDPTTGETMSGNDTSYPPCTASRTDNCVQTYERGRSR